MFTSRFVRLGSVLAALLMVVSLAATGAAEARMGGSFGSRGLRTFSSPSVTTLAPSSVSPIQRSMTPNTGTYAPGAAANGVGYGRSGFWSGFGGGLLGGMLGGLFFHGLFGSMMGYGFGGIGGGFSMIFQLLLIGGLVWLAFRWFRNQQPAAPRGFGSGPTGFPFGGPSYAGGQPGLGNAGPANRDEVGISNHDLEGFEQLLGEVQDAYAREDHQGLRRLSTPEMVSYFSEELADNALHGIKNQVKDLRFLKGELSEGWREGSRDYATVAMSWSAIDIMVDRTTGAVVKGDPDKPVETVELWTFVRDNGGSWQLSAIQDARR
ncbi:MAG: Tim44 domain-containing protein [Devosia sp.]|nr:Tim44 domain-containing protein [Devosia sp.]